MMLVLGAMVLLSILALNINRATLFSDEQMAQSEYIIAATAVGQTLISEAASKPFDVATVTNEKAPLTSFTAPSGLGRLTSEVYPDFNDFDDYHRLTVNVSTPRAGTFRLSCLVDYVDPATPNKTSSICTRTKRLRVTVDSDLLETPVNLVYYKSF
ncbi:MAG: hypothetical protein IH600_06045 [Bacteroidetes bacterium]|nr:hypothetical protein [Bacteroidota bacterium]